MQEQNLSLNNNQNFRIRIMQGEGQNLRVENMEVANENVQEGRKQMQNYKLELSVEQATYLSKFLPPGYSLQFQSKIQKRGPLTASNKGSRTAIQKKKSVDSKLLNENQHISPEMNRAPSIRSKKSNNIKYNDEQGEIGYAKYVPVYPPPETTRRNTYEGLDQSLKPCVKILNMLKNSKTSWPFREPVDAVAMGIPHYIEIIKQPMDLSKIQNNLKSGMYATPTQFHADINKIIRNSYTFNQGNPDFTRVTEEFEQYYFRVIAEPNIDQKPGPIYNEATKVVSKPTVQAVPAAQIKKKKPEKPYSSDNQITLAEKKQLSINIRKLPREHMKGIVEIVKREGDSRIKDEFDLEDLRPETIRELQNYVRSKLMEPAQRMAEGRAQGNKDANEQSDFSIESEEDS